MMGRLTRHAVTLSAAIALAAIAEAGCSHDDSTIFIHGILAPPTAANGACVYSSEPTNASLSSGTLDIGLLATYQPVALFGNQMLARQSNESIRTETSRVTVQGVTVHVTGAGGAIDRSFTALTSGLADPGTTDAPGFGVATVTLVDQDTTERLRDSIPVGGTLLLTVRFKMFGQTLGGQSLESDEFQFPVNVCRGCLVAFVDGSEDEAERQTTGKPNCHAPLTGSSSGGVTLAAPCVLGQDQPADCRLCKSFAVCDPAQR